MRPLDRGGPGCTAGDLSALAPMGTAQATRLLASTLDKLEADLKKAKRAAKVKPLEIEKATAL